MSVANTSADQASSVPSSGAGPASVRVRFWVGAALAVSLIPIFFAQVFWASLLVTPWYVPIGGTLAALMVLSAIGRPRRWWRIGVALLCVVLAGLEWCFVLFLTVLPAYSGPVTSGRAVPAFHASLADGSEISESYFQQGKPTALVFFQGRWCPFCMTQLKELDMHHEDFARVGANVVVVSIENVETAAQTQRDFPHLVVASDEKRELSSAVDLINRGFAPDGSDCATPTILLLDGQGTVKSLVRPTRFIARPSAAEVAKAIEEKVLN